MIKFKKTTHLTCITDFDESNDNILDEKVEVCQEGVLYDAKVVNEDTHKGEDYVDLQFADGSLAMGVQRECFEVVKG